jgi:amidase
MGSVCSDGGVELPVRLSSIGTEPPAEEGRDSDEPRSRDRFTTLPTDSGGMSRERISHEDGAIYEFRPDLEAAATVESGAELTIETRDSLDGTIRTEADVIEAVPSEVNAATGPIAVEGAEPGDVLRVEIEDVRLAEEQGRVITIGGFGLLDGEEGIEAPRTRLTPVDGDTIAFGDLEIPAAPVIGTIGVAPASDSYTTLVPHDHGGNLDTTDITAGTTAYFPVFQEGAMLAMGDCKAAMADGEMCGTGAEIATEIDVALEVLSDPATELERPLLETSDAWKTLASAETLEEACELANRDAIDLLAAEHDRDLTDAYMLSSLVGGLEISQVVDPLVTVRNAVPKAYLSSPF